MSVTLFGSSLGYRHEQPEFDNLSRNAIALKFRSLADNGLANDRESHVAVLEEMRNDGYDLSRLSSVALAQVDRAFEKVGLNRQQVVNELDLQVARFRDNFRPSTFSKPGRGL